MDRTIVTAANEFAFDGATAVNPAVTVLAGTDATIAICAFADVLLLALRRGRPVVALWVAVGATQATWRR